MFMPAAPFDEMSSLLGGAVAGVEKPRPRMLSPGYYSQECNAHKPCDKGNCQSSIRCFRKVMEGVGIKLKKC